VSTTTASSTTSPTAAAPLGDLPARLADEPGLAGVRGRNRAHLAVTEAARPLTIAHLAGGARTPILVAVPTTGDAERLVNDLSQFLGADAVDLFPAWETLPFERVSPSVETVGRRLRTMWHLRQGDATKVVEAGGKEPVVARTAGGSVGLVRRGVSGVQVA